MTSDQISQVLENHDIRPTAQRVNIAKVMLAKPQHLSADDVFGRVNKIDNLVSKATVYNTLNLFAEKKLIREVVVGSGCVFFDSNTLAHHHFYNEDTGMLQDIDDGQMMIGGTPELPENTIQKGIDVVIRIKNQPA